jgi:hypothetical protein
LKKILFILVAVLLFVGCDLDDGANGKDGVDGKGVLHIEYADVTNTDIVLLVTYTDGTTSELTFPKPKDGIDGLNGQDGKDVVALYEEWKQLPGNEYRSFYEYIIYLIYGDNDQD